MKKSVAEGAFEKAFHHGEHGENAGEGTVFFVMSVVSVARVFFLRERLQTHALAGSLGTRDWRPLSRYGSA